MKKWIASAASIFAATVAVASPPFISEDIRELAQTLPVLYNGHLPKLYADLMDEDVELYLEGKLISAGRPALLQISLQEFSQGRKLEVVQTTLGNGRFTLTALQSDICKPPNLCEAIAVPYLMIYDVKNSRISKIQIFSAGSYVQKPAVP